MRIDVHIERVVLLGFDLRHAERVRLQDAIRSELAGLLGTREAVDGLLGGHRVHPPPEQVIRLSGDGDPSRLGRQIALAACRGMGVVARHPAARPAASQREGR
jgi:hypothetical protein